MIRNSFTTNLQRSIVRYSALGIVIISIIVAAVSVVPLYYNLRQAKEADLALVVRMRTIAIEEYLTRACDIASQITSRTQIRKALEAYNQGELDLDELETFTQPKLADALNISPDVVGILRLDPDGQLVTQVGRVIPPDLQPQPDLDSETTIHDPVTIDGQRYLIVSAPIRNDVALVGTDIVLFDLSRLESIVHDPAGLGQTGNMLLGRVTDGHISLVCTDCIRNDNITNPIDLDSPLGQAFQHALDQQTGLLTSPGGADPARVMVYGPVPDSPWAIVVTMHTREMYGLANRQIIILISLIGVLLGLGIIGTLRLVQPLTGKLVLHSDELEREVQEKTATLQMELHERIRAETALRTVNRALETLSECNQALVRATDEMSLLQQTCDILVTVGGYRMAWVGFTQPDRDSAIRPMAWAGHAEGYLTGTPHIGDASHPDQQPIGIVLREHRPWIVQDIANDPAGTPWRAAALECGYAAMIILPLDTDDTPIGILTIYAETPYAFGTEEVKLLQELAGDIGYGLASLRTRIERQGALEALAHLRQRNNLILQAAGEGIYGLDIAGNITFANPAALRMVGYTEEELIGQPHHRLMHPTINGNHHASQNGYVQQPHIRDSFHRTDDEMFWRKDGTPFPVEYISTPMFSDGNLVGVVVSFQDISERKRAEEQLRHQALHDALTGLPNRVRFLELLTHTMKYAQRRGSYPFAVLFLDLDNFKMVNDSLGHLDGDQFLITIAQRIATCLRTSDTIARFGGDEFAILLHNVRNRQDATTVVEKIQRDLARPIHLNGHEVTTSASIGIALSSNNYDHPADLLRDADTALHQAKAQGRNRYTIFDATMRAHVLEQLHLEAAFRRAIEREELRLHYQPIIALDTCTIVGFEALLRWQHPQRGLLPPSEFLRIAEEAGLMVQTGWWIVHEACRQLQAWHTQFPNLRPLSVSVNLSGSELTRSDVVERIRQTLADTGLDAHSLKLEITENVMMDHAETTIATLEALRDLGIQLCIDDFGTGYSSLRYLHRFPIKILKIDRSFISNLNNDIESAIITQSIVMLSHTLGLEIVAEGIETDEQLTYLQELHCEYGQGYRFARALASDAVEALLRTTAAQQTACRLLPELVAS
jgi:diguanylate cyclase (GGDEF)-like protein/PAS domain S-box-containing protein